MKTPSIETVRFVNQFRISKAKRDHPGGWLDFQLGEWHIGYCQTLRLTRLYDENDSLLGCVLGWAIDSSGSMLTDSEKLDFSMADSDCQERMERFFSYLSGRFVALSSSGEGARLYLDPAGQLSTVYCVGSGEIASSLFLISAYREPTDELSQLLDFPSSDMYFPFGLTIDETVFRVLPNHYLDLQSFSQVRHWPVELQIDRFQKGAQDEIPAAIGERLKKNVAAIAGQYPLSIFLTAGKDSRMLLAAAKDLVSALSTYTTGIPDLAATLDCNTAAALSRRFGFDHEILKWKEPTEEDLMSWQIRAGYSGSGRIWRSVTTLRQLDPSKAVLTGACGEVARAFYWLKEDLVGGDLTASMVLNRLGFPEDARLLVLAQKWLDGLPQLDRCDMLDILYIEQRLGCWGAPKYYGHINGIRLAPLADRKIFELILELPKEYRRAGMLAKDVIGALWPELLDFPFNEPIGLLRLTWKTRQRLQRARKSLTEFLTLYPSARKLIPWLRR